MSRVLITGFLLLCVLGTTGISYAENPRLNAQIFRPSSHPGDLFTTLSSSIPDAHLHYSVGAVFAYGSNPLVFVGSADGNEIRQETISDQLTLDIMASLTLFEWVDIGIAIPVHLVNTGQGSGVVTLDDVSPAALGDIRLSPKVRILRRNFGEDGFGLAIDALLVLPSGLADPDAFVSDDFSFQPAVIADYRVGPFLIAMNLGARFRTGAAVDSFLNVDHEFYGRLGASYTVVDEMVDIVGEVYAATSDFTDENMANMEGLLGAKVRIPSVGLEFMAGAGAGFLRGYGNTKFRVFAGVGYAPPIVRDADEDGLLDADDKCVNVAEDRDGYEDEDGCPDLDNDGDGIEDTSDKCPNQAEDQDGYEDEDGCPDLDNDKDGVPDGADKCPMASEDTDGYEDSDGCPDPDNDSDGINDGDDQCPEVPETLNGVSDDDGCPDESAATREGNRITLATPLAFEGRGKSALGEESQALLMAVVAMMNADASIQRLSVHVHTDGRGSNKRNLALSQSQAAAIMTFLVESGVTAERVEAEGHGEEMPVSNDAGELEARARVELQIQ